MEDPYIISLCSNGFFLLFDTIDLRWSIVCIRGHRFYFQMKIVFLSLKKDYASIATSVDPDEMPHYVASHLGLHCLPKYPFRSHLYMKGYKFQPIAKGSE